MPCVCRNECCDTASGLYYTGESESSAALCPRHFYQLHVGPNAACILRGSNEVLAY